MMMKKVLMAKALLCALLAAFAAVSLVAQEVPGTSASTGRCFMSDVSLLNTGNLESYSRLFINGNGRITPKYTRAASDDDYNKIAVLGNSEISIDTPLEIALLSTCTGVVDVRPVMAPEIEAILPKNNPRLSDLKLGAAVYMDMQAAKFLGSDPAPYAAALKFITDRGRVTQANIIDFMKQGIVAAVDAEFNKVNFRLDKGTSISYIAKLTINLKTKEYTLSYERPEIENDDKQITAPSLNALLAEMRSGANKADFDQGCIDRISAKNADILAVRLERTGKDPRADLTAIITAFYLNPTNQTVYGAVRDVNVFYTVAARGVSNDLVTREMYEWVGSAYMKALATLNPELAQRVINDSRGRTSVTLSVDVRSRLQLK
jgi:hypothetical protein